MIPYPAKTTSTPSSVPPVPMASGVKSTFGSALSVLSSGPTRLNARGVPSLALPPMVNGWKYPSAPGAGFSPASRNAAAM